MPAAFDALRGLYNTADSDIAEKQRAADVKQRLLGSMADGVKSYGYGRSFAPAPAYTQGPQAFPTEEDAFGGR